MDQARLPQQSWQAHAVVPALLDRGGRRGCPDTDRGLRGVAVKFYTEEGNYDMVGNNTPIFFVRDPMKFPDFIQSGTLCRHVMLSTNRDHLVGNIVWRLSQAVERFIQERAVKRCF